MSSGMVAGLMSSKLKIKPDLRPLTREICWTVQSVQSTHWIAIANEYMYAFAHLAARCLPLPVILKGLSIVPGIAGEKWHNDSGNALVAALYMNKPSVVELFLDRGAPTFCRTISFGAPLTIAACHASPSTFHLMARNAMSIEDGTSKRLAASRLVAALVQAAACDRPEIFCEETWALLVPAYDHGPRRAIQVSIIRSALLAGHVRVIHALSDLLEKHKPIYEVDVQNAQIVWEDRLEVLRPASADNHEGMLSLILGFLEGHRYNKGIEMLLEDASRAGHLNIVRLLLVYNAEHSSIS